MRPLAVLLIVLTFLPLTARADDPPNIARFDGGVRATPAPGRMPQAVIGTDNRIRITNTMAAPWRSIAYLELYQGSIPVSACTGAFVGPTVILTAAHCVYDYEETGRYFTNIVIVPGKNGASDPFGYDFAAAAWVPPEWRASGTPVYDYALIVLSSATLANRVGWFTIGQLSDASLTRSDFGPVISGYPGTRAEPGYAEHWADHTDRFLGATPSKLYYLIDTEPGESGAPIWRLADGMVVGIHTTGANSHNEGNRVDSALLSDLVSACAQIGCSLSTYVEQAATPTAIPPTRTPTALPTTTVVSATPTVAVPTPMPVSARKVYLPAGLRDRSP